MTIRRNWYSQMASMPPAPRPLGGAPPGPGMGWEKEGGLRGRRWWWWGGDPGRGLSLPPACKQGPEAGAAAHPPLALRPDPGPLHGSHTSPTDGRGKSLSPGPGKASLRLAAAQATKRAGRRRRGGPREEGSGCWGPQAGPIVGGERPRAAGRQKADGAGRRAGRGAVGGLRAALPGLPFSSSSAGGCPRWSARG